MTSEDLGKQNQPTSRIVLDKPVNEGRGQYESLLYMLFPDSPSTNVGETHFSFSGNFSIPVFFIVLFNNSIFVIRRITGTKLPLLIVMILNTLHNSTSILEGETRDERFRTKKSVTKELSQ